MKSNPFQLVGSVRLIFAHTTEGLSLWWETTLPDNPQLVCKKGYATVQLSVHREDRGISPLRVVTLRECSMRPKSLLPDEGIFKYFVIA